MPWLIDSSRSQWKLNFLSSQIGGATGQIGDPSGRRTERAPMEVETVEKNVTSIEENLRRVFSNHERHFWRDRGETEPLTPLRFDIYFRWCWEMFLVLMPGTYLHFNTPTQLPICLGNGKTFWVGIKNPMCCHYVYVEITCNAQTMFESSVWPVILLHS